MIPSLFSVFLDYQCNFECAHCSVGSSPRSKFPMETGILEKFFDELPKIKSGRVVVFTGGEVTLKMPVLLKAITQAKSQGLLTRVVSNGWWADRPERAKAFVLKLKKAGLDEINTSYDDFHMPWAKFTNIINLVRAAREENLPVGIGVIAEPTAEHNGDTVRQKLCDGLGWTREELARNVVIVEDMPTPTGTGEGLDVEGRDAGLKLDVGCPDVVKSISIHPNGTVKACCGHAMFYSKDLTLGSLKEEGLPEIIERAQHNILYWWIHQTGPKRILQQLGVEGTYSSICHACHVLLTEHRERLLDYLAEHKEQIMAEKVFMSDNIRTMTKLVLQKKQEIVERLKYYEANAAPAKR